MIFLIEKRTTVFDVLDRVEYLTADGNYSERSDDGCWFFHINEAVWALDTEEARSINGRVPDGYKRTYNIVGDGGDDVWFALIPSGTQMDGYIRIVSAREIERGAYDWHEARAMMATQGGEIIALYEDDLGDIEGRRFVPVEMLLDTMRIYRGGEGA